MKIKKHSLKIEITCVIILKLIAIYIIYLLFFSNPVVDHLDEKAVSNHLLGSTSQITINKK